MNIDLPKHDDSKKLDLNTLAWVKELWKTKIPAGAAIPHSFDDIVKQVVESMIGVMEYAAVKRDRMVRVVIHIEGEDEPKDRNLEKAEAVKQALWGTYGKSGKEPLKWVRLIDCSTEHLQAILTTQHHISFGTRYVIDEVLKSRAA